MKKSSDKIRGAALPMPLIIIASVVVVVGLAIFITGRLQPSDPTLTQAPPPGPNARPLQISAQKASRPRSMFTMTANGPVSTQVGLTGQANSSQ